MAIIVGDVLRVTANFLLFSGIQYQNIYHYLYDGIPVVDDQNAVDAIDTHLGTAYNEIVQEVSSDTEVDLSSVDKVEFLEGEWVVTENVGVFTMSFTPVGTGDSLPYQSSPFVTFKTARPKSVGRKFLFPFTEPQQDATVLVPGAVTAIVAYAADILDDITVEIINVLHPGIARVGVDDFLVFTTAVVTNVLGSQKRRRPGEGA